MIHSKSIGLALLVLAISLVTTAASAGPREQARRIHDRLVGVPPSETTLNQMEAAVIAGNISDNDQGAAFIAMQNPEFYRTALKNFVTPWTNVEQTVYICVPQ